MFNKKLLLILASSMLLVACGTKPAASSGDGQDYEQATSTDASGYSMYIVGSSWNSWNPDNIEEQANCKFQKEASGKLSYDAVITTGMIDSWQGFKFIAHNGWGEQYGVEDIDIEKCNAAFQAVMGVATHEELEATFTSPTSNRSNVVGATVTASHVGTYHIEFDPTNFDSKETDKTTYTYKFVVNFTAA